MNYTNKERNNYNVMREAKCLDLGITKNQYNWFRRMGEKLHKIYEDYCNGDFGYSEEQYETILDPIEKNVADKARELNLFIYLQTDPRGATIYLDTKPIERNAYNNAKCIY